MNDIVIWYNWYPTAGCQCGIDGNCTKAPHLNSDPICNCDTIFTKTVDEGYLTQKEALPVMKLSYGGAYWQQSSIQYILGPLICSGQHMDHIICSWWQGVRQLKFKSQLAVSGKAKPYPSEIEKVTRDEIKSKIAGLEGALNNTDHAILEEIKTIRLKLESVKNEVIDQIEQLRVNFF